MEPIFVEVAAPPAAVCWKCRGARTKLVRSAAAQPALGAGATERVACPACRGAGTIARSRPAGVKRGTDRSHVVGPPIGPAPAGPAAPGPGEELSFLTGRWRLYQRVDRHEGLRYSTDDVVTAWTAWRAARALLPALAARSSGGGGGGVVARAADIGCGIGSVLLMTAWLHPAAACVGVEAQPARAALARRSAEFNLGAGAGDGGGGGGSGGCRVRVVGGDLRDPATLRAAQAAAQDAAAVVESATMAAPAAFCAAVDDGDHTGVPLPLPPLSGAASSLANADDAIASSSLVSTATPSASAAAAAAPPPPLPPPPLPLPPQQLLFDLVTGTPPYFDVATGGLPHSEETARCLFRYRGGMEAYCEAASRFLARPHGLFVAVETALALERSYAAAAGAGLRVLARLDVVPKTGKPPLVNVFVMCAADAPYQPVALGAAGAPPESEPRAAAADCADRSSGEGGSGGGASGRSAGESTTNPVTVDDSGGAPPTSDGAIPVTVDMLFAPGGQSPYGEPRGYWDTVAAAAGSGAGWPQSGGCIAGSDGRGGGAAPTVTGDDDVDAGASEGGDAGGASGGGDAGGASRDAESDATAVEFHRSGGAAPTAGDSSTMELQCNDDGGGGGNGGGGEHPAGGAGAVPPPPGKRARRAAGVKQRPRPYPGARHGELVHTITVRGPDDLRTREYQALLHELGKPG